MAKRARKLTCAEFQDQLNELFNSGADPDDHPHVKACRTCRLIVQDLQVIAAEARELFPSEWSEVKWWPR